MPESKLLRARPAGRLDRPVGVTRRGLARTLPGVEPLLLPLAWREALAQARPTTPTTPETAPAGPAPAQRMIAFGDGGDCDCLTIEDHLAHAALEARGYARLAAGVFGRGVRA